MYKILNAYYYFNINSYIIILFAYINKYMQIKLIWVIVNQEQATIYSRRKIWLGNHSWKSDSGIYIFK